jgi:hypothetical protein
VLISKSTPLSQPVRRFLVTLRQTVQGLQRQGVLQV